MSADAPGPATKGTILLIDDVAENLWVLADMLLGFGFSPRPVTSGKAALKLLKSLPVDLVLLDANMPEMSGFELCTLLKADPALRDIPVVFLSAADDASHKVEAFRSGASDYLSKPFQLEEVHARVKLHLRLGALERERAAWAARRGELEEALARAEALAREAAVAGVPGAAAVGDALAGLLR